MTLFSANAFMKCNRPFEVCINFVRFVDSLQCRHSSFIRHEIFMLLLLSTLLFVLLFLAVHTASTSCSSIVNICNLIHLKCFLCIRVHWRNLNPLNLFLYFIFQI